MAAASDARQLPTPKGPVPNAINMAVGEVRKIGSWELEVGNCHSSSAPRWMQCVEQTVEPTSTADARRDAAGSLSYGSVSSRAGEAGLPVDARDGQEAGRFR